MASRVSAHLSWRVQMLRLRGLDGLDHVADGFTRVGERFGGDWLIYNPLRMHLYHAWAAADSSCFATAIRVTFPAARSVVDVGSGSGAFAAGLRSRGLDVHALERSRIGRLYSRAQHVPTLPFNLNLDPPATISGTCDLAYCVEVAEHLHPSLGDRLVEFICTLAPAVVYSAAPPGQAGAGHINCQPTSYWEERFARHGYQIDLEATRVLCDALRGVTMSWWLPRNIAVYSRNGSISLPTQSAAAGT